MDGTPVRTDEYLFWLGQTISYMDQYNKAIGAGELDWESDMAGTTLKEFCLNDAMETAKLYALIDKKATELNVAMTAEQEAELQTSLADTIEQMGGEEAFYNQLSRSGLTREAFEHFNKVSYLYEGLQEHFFGAGGEKEPTDARMAEYIAESDLLGAKHILLLTVDMTNRDATTGEYAKLDDATIAQKRTTAEDLLEQLRASDDPQTLFDSLMKQYSEDSGLAANPNGYSFSAGEMVPAFESATRLLEIGQISDIVESSYGYHIILRTNPDSQELREQYISDGMNTMIDGWVTAATVETTDEYAKLDPKAFYEKLLAHQAELDSQNQAESSPAPTN
ncbi:Foldase protein PrsA [bioreactor metagenome]|uniref:Foldase protein PrsA n=1 Tax=bioreactor metagenome TaxID=1076179 RepID=A0A645BJK6_9ZZZZ